MALSGPFSWLAALSRHFKIAFAGTAVCALVAIGSLLFLTTDSVRTEPAATLNWEGVDWVDIVGADSSGAVDTIFGWRHDSRSTTLEIWVDGKGLVRQPILTRRFAGCTRCQSRVAPGGGSILVFEPGTSDCDLVSRYPFRDGSCPISTPEHDAIVDAVFTAANRLLAIYDSGDTALFDITASGGGPAARVVSTQKLSPRPRPLARRTGQSLAIATPPSVTVLRPDQSSIYRNDSQLEFSSKIAALSPNGTLAIAGANLWLNQWTRSYRREEFDPNLPLTDPTLVFLNDARLLLHAGGKSWLIPKDQDPVQIEDKNLNAAAQILGATAKHIAVRSGNTVSVLSYSLYPIPSKLSMKVALGAFLAALLFWQWWFVTNLRSKRHQPRPQTESAETPSAESPEIPVPDIPAKLVEALRARNCVLFAGPALSRLAGWPSDVDFAKSLLEKNGESPAGNLPERVIAQIVTTMEPGALRAMLNDLAAAAAHSPVHDALGVLPFSAIVTTGFERALAHAFRDPIVVTPENRNLKELLFQGERFLLRLHGNPAAPEGRLTVTARQFERVQEEGHFEEFWKSLFASRTILFAGFELNEIEEYTRRALRFSAQKMDGHFALVPATPTLEQEREYWKTEYNTALLPLNPSSIAAGTQAFLQDLAPASLGPAESTGSAVPFLASVKLKDIGPFEDLFLPFDPHWSIILGDNGVGKSTILRAIAAAMAGKDAQRFADRLIRNEQPSGTIVLRLSDGTEYVTVLRRLETGAEVQTPNDRPLTRGFFSIGFPAARTVTWSRVETARLESKGVPKSDDILPLLSGDSDPRLDKLKQWVISLDYEISKGNTAFAAVLDDFFDVAQRLTKGMKMEFAGVSADNRVKLRTVDGELPLEALSQGTGSLLSWVGILIQRLHQLGGASHDSPRRQPVLVLVDELDAHMHPAWQWGLVDRLRAEFPNAQFLASTHSPLIVAGLGKEQVKRFVRDPDGKVVESPLEDYMLRGRADQILTSALFGLDSTLDPVTAAKMDRFRELRQRARTDLSTAELAELNSLENKIEYEIPTPGETPVQHASAMVRAVLESQIPGDQFAGARDRALEAAERLLREAAEQLRRGGGQ